jgi:phosphate-selective porin OprO and OprP
MQSFFYPATLTSVLILMSGSALALSPPQLSADMMYDSNDYEGELFSGEVRSATNIHYLRRLKVAAEMDINTQLSAELAYKLDTDDNQFKIDDAFFTYKLSKALDVFAGRFKEPFGLENGQSLKTQYLMERSAPTNLITFGRHDGIGFQYRTDWLTAQAAAMSVPSDQFANNDGYAYVGRFTLAPIHRKKHFIHLGAGATQRDIKNSEYQLEEKLIAHGVGNLIKSAKYDTKAVLATNVELAAQYSSVLLQAEYLQQVLSTVSEDDILLDGGYLTLLWTALGKSRVYDKGQIKFNPSAHTLELAYRYSLINMTGAIKGDAATVHELALNFYLDNDIKVVLQYQQAEHKDWNDERELNIAEGQSLNLRFQLMWQ